MTETTQEERDQIIQRLAESDINVSDEVCGLICDAVQDADRLAAIEQQVRKLAESAGWNEQYSTDPVATSVHGGYHKKLRAILDPPGHP